MHLLIRGLCCFFLFVLGVNTAFAEYKKIVVIGAGLSGMTTAYRIQQLIGEPVEIYEARHRVGGRVLTAYFNRSYAELGAKFISDGGDAPNLKAMIKEMGLEIDNYVTTISARKYYDKGKAAPYYSPFYRWKEPDEANFSLLKEWTKDSKNLSIPLERFFSGNEIAHRLTQIRMRGYFGNDMKDLSTHYLDNFWKYYQKCYAISHGQEQNIASHETVKGGNSLLPQKMSEALKDRIHLGRPVKKISKSHDGKQFVLEFPNSQIVTTDVLILTMPCSTLRDVEVQEGIFPSDQWKAIKTLQYGTNGYVLMGVKLGDEDKSEYSVTQDAIAWFNHDRTILCLDFGGELGKFDAGSPVVMNKIIKDELPALKMLFPSMKYDGKRQALSWVEEEYSKGSYCSWGVGQYNLFNETVDSLGETVRKVFRPINNQIFFAGEHTALEYPTTMEGAVESGERTARMVARALKPAAFIKQKETMGPGS